MLPAIRLLVAVLICFVPLVGRAEFYLWPPDCPKDFLEKYPGGGPPESLKWPKRCFYECRRRASEEHFKNPSIIADRCFVAVSFRKPEKEDGTSMLMRRDIDMDGIRERLEIRGTGNAIKQIYVFKPREKGFKYLGRLDASYSFSIEPDPRGVPTITYVYRAGADKHYQKWIQHINGEYVETASRKLDIIDDNFSVAGYPALTSYLLRNQPDGMGPAVIKAGAINKESNPHSSQEVAVLYGYQVGPVRDRSHKQYLAVYYGADRPVAHLVVGVGGLQSFEKMTFEENIITLTGKRWEKGDGQCCPSAATSMRLAAGGGQLIPLAVGN